MKKWLVIAALLLCAAYPARALEEDMFSYDDTVVYRIYDEDGTYVTSHCGRVYDGDEYIAGDDTLYRIGAVDESSKTAVASAVGREVFAALAENKKENADASPAPASGKRLICMYSTHSDESYEPTDGTSSKTEGAGIYDVGEALKKNLEALGIEVEYSEDTFLPHDAGAYRRSRQTAASLMKSQPAALLDLHRDGIPDPDEYEQEIEGEDASKVRLLVGRSNPNADANRQFAKQIKAAADEKYPDLIKDIYIGKGNYNQELYPQAILLEFGTHTIDKERAIQSTEYMADVLNGVLFGGTAKAENTAADNNASAKGIGWIIGLAVLAALVYALASTGTFGRMARKLKRGASEVTGGMMGEKPDDEDK